jgi:hypothetical protein
VKYGLTSAVHPGGPPSNPDFSQVESDTFQVEVNQRFPDLLLARSGPSSWKAWATFELAGAWGRRDHAHRGPYRGRIVDPR